MLAHLWRNLAQVDYAGPIVDSCVCDIHLPGETWLEGHIGIMAVDGCGEVDSLSLYFRRLQNGCCCRASCP